MDVKEMETVEEEHNSGDEESSQESEAPEEAPEAEVPSLVEEAQAQGEARIEEMEVAMILQSQRVSELEGINQQLETSLAQREEEAEALRQEVAQAVNQYRSLLLSSAPEVPEELVQGETLSEVDESFASAKQMVERVRNQLEAQKSQDRVPTGAPTRGSAALSTLSAREKIAYALARR